MRQNGIPSVFRHIWPVKTNLDYPDLKKSLLWSPWGVFKSQNIHCYTEDYRFEITWRKPELTLKRVLELNYVIAPDFSVYEHAPDSVNRWQLYRSLAVYSYWQNMGVNVIPSINWICPNQIKTNLDLYPGFSIISVRCPTKSYLTQWMQGAEQIKKHIQPETVLHFGTALGLDIWSDCKVYNFSLRPKLHQFG